MHQKKRIFQRLIFVKFYFQIIDPNPVEDEHEKNLPTFTVKSDGELNYPTPKPQSEIDFENEIEPTKHRFEPPQVKTALDSVTYIGFVDFTTTIDDTVVIFRPKKSFRTDARAVFLPKIEPTQISSDRINIVQASKSPGNIAPPRPAIKDEFVPKSEPEQPRSQAKPKNLKDLFQNRNKNRSSFSPFNKQKSASLSPSNQQSSVKPSGSVNPSEVQGNFGGRPKVTILSRPQQSPNLEIQPEIQSSTKEAPEIGEIASSIDPDSDVELVYKTLYTTYTYFTTFFRASSTRVKSREEVISNVITLTNILGPSDLAKLKSSCQVDSTCQFISSTAAPQDFTNGFIGRPNTREAQNFIEEAPRSNNNNNDVEDNGVFKTFYTTYTYFTTLFVDGGSSISTRTEIYSNVQSSGVPIANTDAPQFSISASQKPPVISAEPANLQRRLEYSSIARGINLNSDLTTEQSEDDFILEAATTEVKKMSY